MKKLTKIIISAVALCLLCAVAVAGINLYVVVKTKNHIVSPENLEGYGADCILVLGCGVWDNERPSHMLEDRLRQGVDLYNLGASDRLLMSGDHGRKEYDEVNVMKSFAIDKGVASECIFMDHAGFSTYESLYRAKEIFEADKIVIVTQKYHLFRALYVAEKMGIEAVGVASDPRRYVGEVYREVREVLARNKDFFMCFFKPEPTYLGEAIPVSGNGDLTND